MKVNLGTVLIGVKDINRAVPFYEKVFGVRFSEIRPPFSCFTMNGIEFNVEENSPERSDGWVEKNIGTYKPVVFETDDLGNFLQTVESFGGRVIETPHDQSWGWREAKFADPDGNEFIVEQEI